MSDTRISALPNATTLTGTEVFPLVQGGATKKAPLSDIITDLVDSEALRFVNPVELNASTINLVDGFSGYGYYQEVAATSTINVPNTLSNGFVGIFYSAHASSVINIVAGSGVTLTNVVTGETGDFKLNGFGVCTVWKTESGKFLVHGSNVELA